MRLRRIRLTDVRGIDACELRLSTDGVTIIEAPNEAGKTTLLDAVDVAMRFPARSRDKAVRSLWRVDRDVAAVVEFELTCGSYHLTCTKSFHRLASNQRAELIVHAPDREQLTGDEAHDRLRTILTGEVDLDLYAALRFDQGRGLAPVSLQSSRVLADRLDAVAGGDGGAADDALLDRVVAEYQRYFTPGGREGKVLGAADARVEELAAEHDEVVARLADLESASEELAGIDADRPELQRRLDDEIVPRLTAVEEELARIATRAEVVAARRAEHDAAVGRHDAARRAREERRRAVGAMDELSAEVRELEARLGPVRQRRRELEDLLSAREQDLAAAAETAERARQERETAQLLVDLVQVRRDRERLAGRQERIDALNEAARTAETALAAIRLDDQRLAAIRAADQRHRVAEATLTAGAPRVTVTPQRDVELRHDGTVQRLSVADGSWSRSVADRLHLEVPDVLAIEVRAGGTAGDLQRDLDEAAAELVEACRVADVADPATAEEVARQRAQHLATLERRDAEVARELEGMQLEELAAAGRDAQDRMAALQGRLPADVDPAPSLDAARARSDAARPAQEQAEAAAVEARAARDAVRQEVADLATRVATDEATLQGRRDQLARDRAALGEARREQSDDDLEQVVTATEAAVSEGQRRVRAAEEELQRLDPGSVELDAETLRHERATTSDRLAALRERGAALRERLDLGGQQGLGERAQELEQQLARALADQRRLRARAAAAQLLHEELTTARDEVYRAYRAPLVERIVQQARLLYRREDVDIRLDDDLAIAARTLDGVTLDWEQLSAGAREQLAILSALAAAQLAGNDGVPFVLDDALGYTDPQRLRRLGALLGRTTGAQVIVLTCMADRFRHVGNATTLRLLEARGDEDPT